MTPSLSWRQRFLQPGLWANPEFLKLWSAQSISFIGSQITLLALPLAATVELQASPGEMGLLRAVGVAPALLFGLVAGALIDRLRRRPILILCDLAQAVLIASIPVASFLGLLNIGQLYVVAFLAGVCAIFFDVAHMSLLPTLIPRERLIEGNSKLEMSRSFAKIVGPGLAGLLVQLLTASIALVMDALSFLGSAFFLLLLRTPETPPLSSAARPSLRREVAEGLRSLWSHPLLRTMALSLCVYNFFSNMIAAVYVLYAVNELAIMPATLGLIYTLGSIGFACGALLAGRAAGRFGVGPVIVWGAGFCDAAFLLIPLARGEHWTVVPLLIAAQFFATFAGAMTAINQMSLRQAITPDRLLGRVNATMRVIGVGAAPLGALAAGLLGGTLGLWPTLVIGATGIQFGFVVLLISRLRAVREAADAQAQEQTV
jgi:MFS family permease